MEALLWDDPASDEGLGSKNYFSQTIDSLKDLCRPSDSWPGRWISNTETFWRSFSSRFQENELLIALILCHAWTIGRNWAHSHYSIIYGRQWAVNELSISNGIDIEQDSCMRNSFEGLVSGSVFWLSVLLMVTEWDQNQTIQSGHEAWRLYVHCSWR